MQLLAITTVSYTHYKEMQKSADKTACMCIYTWVFQMGRHAALDGLQDAINTAITLDTHGQC